MSKHTILLRKNLLMQGVVSAFIIILVLLGIALFFMRGALFPSPLSPEPIIRAKTSSSHIIADQFLVLIHPSHAAKLKDILAPLQLSAKTPLLNWLLVGRSDTQEEIVPLFSEQAQRSRQTLASLLKHPLILDAQHNYVLESTLNASFSTQLPDPAPQARERGEPVVVAVVDQFSQNGQLSFFSRFNDHQQQLAYVPPVHTHSLDKDALPHGEIMLRLLFSHEETLASAYNQNLNLNIVAVERANRGQAESFLAALRASHIDNCQNSIIACEKHTFSQWQKPALLLLPFATQAPELLQFTTDMLSAVSAQGIIVVTSAGNNQENAQSFFPGGNPFVINVAALNRQEGRASFSNWGKNVDILVPGEDIAISYPNGTKKVSGTSVAAAELTAALALMKTTNRALTQKEAEYLLKRTAKPIICEDYCPDESSECTALCCVEPNRCGGALQLDAALAQAKTPIDYPLIRLKPHYGLYSRDEAEPQVIEISNDGNKATTVRVKTFNDTIKVNPSSLWLDKKGSDDSIKSVTLSFEKEPYTKQTFKIEFLAQENGVILDREEFYIEYIPKN